ncbi:hypothetical protein [Eggerthella lenta]|uniref:hypothetical protein n=1 Tax=Eggerthella lenta TaxID=84112 RepID=UPI0022E98D3A|nr:hypothetical protein [Eggerthella lenta]
MNNWEKYFGTPDKAARMEIAWRSWPACVDVCSIEHFNDHSVSHRDVVRGMTPEEFREWLDAEHDDGTIVFED